VLLLAAMAACIHALFVHPLLQPVAAVSDTVLGSRPTFVVGCSATVSFLVAWWRFGRGRFFAWLGLRHFASYPPIWLAALLGGVLAIWLGELMFHRPGFAELDPHSRWRYGLLTALWLAFVGPASIDLLRTDLAGVRPSASANVPESAHGDIFAWASDDREVTSPENDRFNHAGIAHRVAARLRGGVEGSAIAVVGPQGAGKSTVRALVEYELRNDASIEIVTVSLWAYADSDAAMRGILHAMIDAVAGHVQVVSLSGLPDEYAQVVEKTPGWAGALGRLLRSSGSPSQILQTISAIAVAIDIRFVVWIEDIERFDEAATKKPERLSPVSALLYLLDQSPRITVVVATVDLSRPEFANKIPRYVESLSEPDPLLITRQLATLLDRCQVGYPRPVLLPRHGTARAEWNFEGNDIARRARLLSEANQKDRESVNIDMSASFAAVQLINTPRTLKMIIRSFDEAWRMFAGEIDMDALLALEVLRQGCPKAFAFMVRNSSLFHQTRSNISVGTTKRPSSEDAFFDYLKELDLAQAFLPAIRLMHLVFPSAAFFDLRIETVSPQIINSVRVRDPVDKWKAYLARQPVDTRLSDQACLEEINEWNEGKGTRLVARLCDPKTARQVSRFSREIEPPRLLDLWSHTVESLRFASPDPGTRWERYAGVAQAVEILRRQQPDQDLVVSGVSTALKNVWHDNLPLASDIVHGVAGMSVINRDVIQSDETRNELRNSLRRELCTHFVGPGAVDRLRIALRDGGPWTVHYITAFGNGELTDPSEASETPNWPEFSNILLDLAEQFPAIGIPILATLSVGAEMEERWVARVDADRLTKRFDAARVRTIVQKNRRMLFDDEPVQVRFSALVKWADAHS